MTQLLLTKDIYNYIDIFPLIFPLFCAGTMMYKIHEIEFLFYIMQEGFKQVVRV